ncbi:MAG: hypothetical protein VB878_09660, partial [Pirellulaceae bacterium]
RCRIHDAVVKEDTIMHTVDLLHEALETAQQLGYGIRHEWLGTGGGACELTGRKWLFVDLAMNSQEQLEKVCEALQQDARLDCSKLSDGLSRWLQFRRAA